MRIVNCYVNIRNIILLTFSYILFAAGPLSSEVVLINKIKVIGNKYTDTKIILDFVREFSENTSIDETAFSDIVERIQERLMKTQWFESVKCYIVELGNHKVNLVIDVQEGYLLRYWGGDIYGGFGIDNLFGLGKFSSLELGYNKQYLTYSDKFIGNEQCFYDLGIGNKPTEYLSSGVSNIWVQELNLYEDFGINLPYDFMMGLGFNTSQIYSSSYYYLDSFVDPLTFIDYDTRDKVFSPGKGMFCGINCGFFYPQDLTRIQADYRTYFSLVQNLLKFAFRLNGGLEFGTVNDDYFMLSLGGIDGVRSDYVPGMIGISIMQLNTELRLSLFKIYFLDFVVLEFEPALFFDIGEAYSNINAINGFFSPIIGFGPSIHINLGDPLYIPLRFDFGFGVDGRMNFFFAIENPF